MPEQPGFLFTFLNARVLLAALPEVAKGFLLTVELALLVVVCGLIAGLLAAVLRLGGRWWINLPLIFVVDLLRAVPPLVIIVLLFFGLPSLDVELSAFVTTWITLTAVLAAFAEEIFWASIRAVPTGQKEAARSLGLGALQTLCLVTLPQALRIAVPPLTNRTIAIVKGTAFGSVVGLSDILGAAQSVTSFTANPSPLILGTMAYVVLFTPIILLARWIESRFAWSH
ncbi:amino acid ABC transporter permease [Pararoseomonas sp. SCSIO 73927]|uniref:amino acid ABC transporter permease n=1 Tax=Pararoseomonas sp. SCSIO 73927 TaxID=3114537 RepID=UPI0030CF2AD8